jgi:hypothetical protein
MRTHKVAFAAVIATCAAIVGPTAGVACTTCGPTLSQQASGSTAQGAAFSGLDASESTLRGIRDGIQGMPPTSSGMMRYNADSNDDDTDLFSPFVLSYAPKKARANNPLVKAPPPPQPVSNVQYAVWGMGFGEEEDRSGNFAGVDIGRTTRTVGGLVGADAVFTNFMSMPGAVVFGVLGGTTEARANSHDGSSALVQGPGVGVYGAYVNGGFSIDGTSKVDFFGISNTAPATGASSVSMNNYSNALNVNQKFQNVFGTWWAEPTAGFTYMRSIWDGAGHTMGFVDGTTWRVQTGVRFGTSVEWNGIHVEPTLLLWVYDDVTINGGSVAAVLAPTAPNDEGKVFLAATGKLNFVLTNNLSASLEGEVRGHDNILATAIRGGLRYSFK